MWPDCSPPKLKPRVRIASTTYRSPTAVRTTLPPLALDRVLEPEVAITVATSVRFLSAPGSDHARRAERHHDVAVDLVAAVVDDDDAVGVSVERDAEVRAVAAHLARAVVGVKRARLVIDVLARSA